MKPGSLSNLFILFFVLIVVGFFYKQYSNKLEREESGDVYEAIQKYLLDDVTLGKSKKPILWVHVPYEYNSRNWLSFGSRSSFELNQPYLYLTMRSIIRQCDKSFTICIIDDASFKKLIPGWNINMTTISDPILSKMRMLGIAKLMYIYGGLLCPLSFVCLKDLYGLYIKGTRGDKMFTCEMIDRNSTSLDMNFFPSLQFYGAPKECNTTFDLITFMQHIISNDYTAESVFLGDFARWCQQRIEQGQINLIDGTAIGVKTTDNDQIVIDDLMSNHYLKICPDAYGIVIPSKEILNRRKFEWFARLSEKQVLQSDTIIGNYLLVAVAPYDQPGILEPLEPSINKKVENEFVSFWKTPLDAPVWGLKPDKLGDNMQKLEYPGR
jgi:hypothetical protein